MSVSDYKASVHVLALLPKWNKYGEAYTEVYEEHRVVKVKKPILSVIEEILKFNGQTLRGAKEGTRALLGNIYLPPLTINEVHGVYWFYTEPLSKLYSPWFALGGIETYDKTDNGGTEITLINGKKITLEMGCKAFSNRENATIQLQNKREQRTKLMLRSFQYCDEYNGDNEEGDA